MIEFDELKRGEIEAYLCVTVRKDRVKVTSPPDIDLCGVTAITHCAHVFKVM